MHDHVVLLAILLEARDLPPAEHCLQCAPDRIDVDAHVGQLVAADGDPHFGRVEAEVRLQVLHTGVLTGLVEEAVDDALQLRIRHLRHDHVFDRRRSERLAERGWIDRKRERSRNRHEFRAELVG